jgi:uncharacterized protein (TIGR02246 family)
MTTTGMPASCAKPYAATEQECVVLTVEKALSAVRERYMDAYNRGDAEAIAALHTAGSVSMPAGHPSVSGRDSIRQLMQESLSRAPAGFRFEFQPIELRIADDWAAERGVTKGVGPIPSGKYVMLYQRESDGCWRIAWTITNSDPPTPER